MSKILLLTGLTILLGSIAYIDNQNTITNEFNQQFSNFKLRFNKRYSSIEDKYRLAIYVANMIEAQLHNSDPTQTWTMGETQFSDLTQEEFVHLYLTTMTDSDNNDNLNESELFRGSQQTANAVDWRNFPGVATHVKNQGQCGSCWAFSTVGAVEAYFATVKNVLNLDLAEQQLVDCDTQSFGCDGGYKDLALNYVQKNGLNLQTDYKYTALDGTCLLNTGPYKNTGNQRVAPNDDGLRSALNVRPVAVSVDASNWSRYTGGIFNNCAAAGTNHAVLAFGYDADSWLVKNSWGTGWGDQGFIRLSLGNTCAVLSKIYIAN